MALTYHRTGWWTLRPSVSGGWMFDSPDQSMNGAVIMSRPSLRQWLSFRLNRAEYIARLERYAAGAVAEVRVEHLPWRVRMLVVAR